jgi:hypothetical protein
MKKKDKYDKRWMMEGRKSKSNKNEWESGFF